VRGFVFGILFFLAFSFQAQAATLKKIRYKPYEDKIRVVLDLEGNAYYKTQKKDRGVEIRLINCETEYEDDHRIYNIKDWIVKSLEVKEEGRDILIYIPLEYQVEYKVTPLGDPTRLVIDFGRQFSKQEFREEVVGGLDYFYVMQGDKSGIVGAHVLLADPKKVDVFPALAMRSPGFIDSLMNVFTPWQKLSRVHFYRDKVSSITDRYNAVAGINGTYFSSTGRPLGVLVINQELISYPIYNRTSLIIDKNQNAMIDQVILDGYVEIDGERYEITGVNEPRESNDVIVFTSHYGELTGTNRYGYELTIKNGRVVSGQIGNSKIPADGFVISFSPMFIEHVFEKVKINHKAKTHLQLIPYSKRIKNDVLHVMGGGPRLLKKGRVYVTKHTEKFKKDIANGRAARSAVGVTKSGKIMFIAVDGKPRRNSPWRKSKEPQSRGMTLEELAKLMKSLGVLDAVNLDGGGSSAMVINGKVKNRPVDGNQKRVSNALLIRPLE